MGYQENDDFSTFTPFNESKYYHPYCSITDPDDHGDVCAAIHLPHHYYNDNSILSRLNIAVRIIYQIWTSQIHMFALNLRNGYMML